MIVLALGACTGGPDTTEIAGTWRIEFDPAPCDVDNIVRTVTLPGTIPREGADAEWLDATGGDAAGFVESWDENQTTWHIVTSNASGITDMFLTPGSPPTATAYYDENGADPCVSPEVAAAVEKIGD